MISNTLQVRPEHLRALFAVAPTRDVRHYLNGAHIETGDFGAYGVATNGHCMLVVRLHRDPLPAGRLFAPSCWKLPAGNLMWTLTTATDSETVCTLEHLGGTLRYSGDLGSYPKWRLAVPASANLTAGAFSCRVTDALSKAAKLLGCKDGFFIATNGPGKAALVEFPGADAFGVAMPMRHGIITTPPDWFAAVQVTA